jgi:integrase/recombinase XerC
MDTPAGAPIIPAMQPLATYLEPYLEALERRVKPRPVRPSTVKTYKSDLSQFCAWLDDRRPTDQLLNDYRAHLQKTKRPRSIKRAFCAMASLFDWLKAEHRLKLPRAREVWTPPFDEPLLDLASDEDVAALFQAAATMEDYSLPDRLVRGRALVMISLAADCGMRPGDILALNVGDVKATSQPPHVLVRDGKGGKSRWVPLNSRALRHVRQYLEIRKEWCDQQPARRGNLALFAVDRRRRVDEDSKSRLWHRLLHRAGLDGRRIRLHELRHWFITTSQGAPDVTSTDVAAIVGHAKVETTEGYTHPKLRRMMAAAEWVCQPPPAPLPPPEPLPLPPPPAPAPPARPALPTGDGRRLRRHPARGRAR